MDGPSRLAWSRRTRPGSAATPASTSPFRSPAESRTPPVGLPGSPANGPPCPANGLLPPFFAVAAVCETHAGEKREPNSGTGGRPDWVPHSPRTPLPGSARVGVLEGVCEGVTVGVGVGVQQGSATTLAAAAVLRAAILSLGLRRRDALSGGGEDDELDLERSGRERARNARGMVGRKILNTHVCLCIG